VYIDGSFDILHQGHIDVLRKAKAMGDFLYVGVYDNEVVIISKFRLLIKLKVRILQF
jgi:ethanolamine-phosphate cytidylyltransferase